MQIYRNFIHHRWFLSPFFVFPSLARLARSRREGNLSRATARGDQNRGKDERSRDGGGSGFLKKKSRFLVNYECHQFLSWSHCVRHSGTLPPLSPSFSRGRGERYRGTRGKKARKGGRHEKGRATGAAAVALLYPCSTLSVPPFLSVSRKNRKSAAPKKYYERDFMAAGCTLTYIHGSKDDLSRKTGIERISRRCGY